MMHSIDFFRDEIRNGFYIPTAIKQAWAEQLVVLSEIDRICTKHNISYFADWGTLLGAVRHGGFVPWDDDIDICMKREDYKKFRAVADTELPHNYVIHDYARKENHWFFISRVVGNATVCFDEDYLLAHNNFPWLSSVDIFVKDYLYRDPIREKERCDEIMFILAVAEGIITGSSTRSSIQHNLNILSEKYSYNFPSIDSGRKIAVSLYALAELQMSRVPEDESDRLCTIYPRGLKGNPGDSKECFASALRLPFEGTTIPVPISYKEVLTTLYGDYNVIRKGTAIHNYPSFDAQREQFEQTTGAKVPVFTFDKRMLNRPVPNKSNSYKTLAKECLEGLYSLYNSAVLASQDNDLETLEYTLNNAQQLALDLGTTIEHIRGEEDPHTKAVVLVLEKLCETIYNCYQNAQNKDMATNIAISSESNRCILSPIKDRLESLEDAITTHILSRQEVLFLPIGAEEWKTLSHIYYELANDPSVDIVAIHLPLMFKDYFGNVIMSEEYIRNEEKKLAYPEGLISMHYTEYDLALHCPDKVFIQFPYDGENPCLTVPNHFYAKELLLYTDDLVYVPIGKTSEFGSNDGIEQSVLKFYVTMPGVIYADHVFVQSENIKTQYINALCSFSESDTCKYWQRKICSRPELFLS